MPQQNINQDTDSQQSSADQLRTNPGEHYVVDNVGEVCLNCRITDDKLHLNLGDVNLRDYQDCLITRVPRGSTTSLIVEDFVHEGHKFITRVFSVNPDSTLAPWPRQDGGSCLQRQCQDDDPRKLPFVVIAVREDGGKTYADHYPITITDPM